MSTSKARYTLTVGANSIDITNDRVGKKAMSMSFMRTIRVPDNNIVNDLPADIGVFPLHKIRDHAPRLPKKMVAKGGAFFPMHREHISIYLKLQWHVLTGNDLTEKEAMWIDFTAHEPFIVKVYAGGVNTISGEHHKEDINTKFRRLKDRLSGKQVQDYAVLPNQPWLDGIAVSPGVVRQFVAMPLGEGYGIEAQMTGQEVTGGLQFEITPLKEGFMPGSFLPDRVFVETPAGHPLKMACSVASWTGLDLKRAIREQEGVSITDQRLIFDGGRLEDGNPPSPPPSLRSSFISEAILTLNKAYF